MRSPLRIRAPTRPLILQCVTELEFDRLVTSSSTVAVPVFVLVSNSVGVSRCATSTDDCADDRALLTTDCGTEQCACACAGCSGYLVTMTIPNRSITIPTISVVTTSVITLFVASTIETSVSSLRASGNRRDC